MYHKLKYDLNDLLVDLEVSVYSVKLVKDFNREILQVLLDSKTPLTFSVLEEANTRISNYLDSLSGFDLDNYLLEVSSRGAERELLDTTEVLANIGSYVHLELFNNEVYEGYLEAVDDETYTLKINVKGRITNVKIKINDTKLIRLAVKL